MQIRHTRPEDLPAMQEIFADARAFMRENGNPDQWGDRFPTQEMLDKDLALHRSYVCEDNGKIAAAFAFTTDGEPTYRVIRGGAWLDDAPYGVVHRIAAAKGTHGAASFCMNWCMECLFGFSAEEWLALDLPACTPMPEVKPISKRAVI